MKDVGTFPDHIGEIWNNLPFEIKEEPKDKDLVLKIINAIVSGVLVPRAPEELFEAVQEGIGRSILDDIAKETYLYRILHRKPRLFPAPVYH